MQKRAENRAKILDAFEQLPDTIRTLEAACKLEVFGGDEDEALSKRATEFYELLFQDLPILIEILLRKKITCMCHQHQSRFRSECLLTSVRDFQGAGVL